MSGQRQKQNNATSGEKVFIAAASKHPQRKVQTRFLKLYFFVGSVRELIGKKSEEWRFKG